MCVLLQPLTVRHRAASHTVYKLYLHGQGKEERSVCSAICLCSKWTSSQIRFWQQQKWTYSLRFITSLHTNGYTFRLKTFRVRGEFSSDYFFILLFVEQTLVLIAPRRRCGSSASELSCFFWFRLSGFLRLWVWQSSPKPLKLVFHQSVMIIEQHWPEERISSEKDPPENIQGHNFGFIRKQPTGKCIFDVGCAVYCIASLFTTRVKLSQQFQWLWHSHLAITMD